MAASDNRRSATARGPATCRLAAAVALGATALGVVALGPGASAQSIVAAENPEMRNSLARDPGGHWTPDRLARARPRDLPRASGAAAPGAPSPGGASPGEASPQLAPAAGPSPGRSRQSDGRLPPAEAEVRPNLSDRLFAPASVPLRATLPEGRREAVQVVPFDVGAGPLAGTFFSSSRLVPTDARLHYPYRAAGKLFFEQPGEGDFVCSAAVIAPRLVLTAGHCVHRGSGGAEGYFRRFLFVPAYHEGQAPYQAWNYTFVVAAPSWTTSNGNVPNRADLAVLEMEDRRFDGEVRTVGQTTGWLGFRTNALMPNHTKKVGYPVEFDNGEIMHQVDSQSHGPGGEATILYGSDMRGGSSGGPWIENFGVQAAGQTGGLQPNPNRVVGVTSYGFESPDPKVQGSSVLGEEFLAILNAACARQPGNCQ